MIRFAKKILSYAQNYAGYVQDWRKFSKLQQARDQARFPLMFANRIPAIWEKSKQTQFDAHYVYHNAWAIRTVLKIQPAEHFDISSTLYFCSTLSASLPVRFFDYRPAPLTLSGLTADRCDLMDLPFDDNSVVSLSCMHTVEHVGLGRYGDRLDPAGDLRAFSELQRVVAPGGDLLVVIPVGQQRLCFNAHRVYSHATIMKIFIDFELMDAALITDDGRFLDTPGSEQFDAQVYGCGCYWFRKCQS
jgi:SAM-dependent methyltransferase